MRIFRMISGITLLSGSGWLGPFLAEVFEVSGADVYASAIVAFVGGMLFYSGLPFKGTKTVRVGKFRCPIQGLSSSLWSCSPSARWRRSLTIAGAVIGMSGRSTDGYVPGPVGRTGWDFLDSSKSTILIVIAVLALVTLAALRPDAVDAAVEGVRANAVYALPLIAGFLFGRHLYRRYLRQYVIVQVEDPEHNVQAEYEVSRQRFEAFHSTDGIVRPVSTMAGIPLYRMLEFDPVSMEGRAGWCHDPCSDLPAVLLVRERWEALVMHDHDATLRAEELASLGYLESYAHARDLANRLLDGLSYDHVDYGLDHDDAGSEERRDEEPEQPVLGAAE